MSAEYLVLKRCLVHSRQLQLVLLIHLVPCLVLEKDDYLHLDWKWAILLALML